MVRKAIHGLEQSLEDEEERLEKLRQKRFINPLQHITEVGCCYSPRWRGRVLLFTEVAR